MNKLNYLSPWIREAEIMEINAIRLCANGNVNSGFWALQDAITTYKKTLWGLSTYPITKEERKVAKEINRSLERITGISTYLFNMIQQKEHSLSI